MDVTERERLARLEQAVEGINGRLDRQIPHIRQDLADLRGEVDESRTECTTGLARLGDVVRVGFERQRDSARAWTLGAVTTVTGVLGVAVAVLAVVLK